MKEHPILFKGRLVRAIIADQKTETRRVGPGAARWLKARKGDRLWVRETFATHPRANGYLYRADESTRLAAEVEPLKWKPSIHMPRAASRLLLELTEDPRLEPLQAMDESAAKAEGVVQHMNGCWFGATGKDGKPDCWPSALGAFRSLWDSINAGRGYAWADDPEVVVLTFKVVAERETEPQEDF